MKNRIKLLLFIFALFVNNYIFASPPTSKEAKFIEQSSPNEVLIEATGIYNSEVKGGLFKKNFEKDIEENGLKNAILDAKKTAIYYLLFSAPEYLIKKENEKIFYENEDFFYSENSLSKYITYEDMIVKSKILINNGAGIRIVKVFKVNKEKLIEDLENEGIINKRLEVKNKIGNPFIMVIPVTEKGKSPIVELQENAEKISIASSIESYLTSKQYEVIVPEQQMILQELNTAQTSINSIEEDVAYKLALSIGSDIYITYSGSFENAGYGTEKFALSVKAFETTTGRLLGTEIGYSRARKGEKTVSIEEASLEAIDKVLSKVNNYWTNDIKKGIQYKMILNLSTGFDEDEIEEIQFLIEESLVKLSKSYKQNIITNNTMDYLLWIDSNKYNNSMSIFKELKNIFDKNQTNGSLKRVNLNRKTMILKVDKN